MGVCNARWRSLPLEGFSCAAGAGCWVHRLTTLAAGGGERLITFVLTLFGPLARLLLFLGRCRGSFRFQPKFSAEFATRHWNVRSRGC